MRSGWLEEELPSLSALSSVPVSRGLLFQAGAFPCWASSTWTP